MVFVNNQHCTKEIWKKMYHLNAFDQHVSFYRNQIYFSTDDRRAQEAMTRALVDVNKKMVTQMKSNKTARDVTTVESPATFHIPSVTPARTQSACTNVTVEG